MFLDTRAQAHRRWWQMWERLCKPLNRSSVYSEYCRVTARYKKSDRHYHDLGHITYCLDMLEKHHDADRNIDAIEVAIWYHDAVYHTYPQPAGIPDNESLSAAMCDEALVKFGMDLHFRNKVFHLIMATKHQHNATLTQDEKLIADIDWSSMGESWEDFSRNSQNIRMEYSSFSDEVFRDGRKDFFRNALNRSQQYHLAAFRQLFEDQTRINMTRALRELEKKRVVVA